MELGEEKRKVSSDDFFFVFLIKKLNERMRRKNERKKRKKEKWQRERERDRRACRKSLSYFAASFRDMVVLDM